MTFQEGYNTARPLYFDENDFAYWKDGFEKPNDASGAPLPTKEWSKDVCKKAQVNAKATTILQCELSKEQLRKVGPFDSVKELWKKLIELNEGSSESRRVKRDLLVGQLQTFTMKPNEMVSQIHGQFKKIVNHSMGINQENA
ncbi:uncharacterized protein LOC141842884 [Curcuma longa]|uniref:uncharacterized protein LOC141842884 n=1 Tax=Curcuma longa TaxID=136217 RepID=UPI003D9F2EE0